MQRVFAVIALLLVFSACGKGDATESGTSSESEVVVKQTSPESDDTKTDAKKASRKPAKLSREEALQELRKREIAFTTEAFSNHIQRDDAAVLKLFLAAGMDPNLRFITGVTALMVAANGTDPSVVELLLAAGADVNAHLDGYTAFNYGGKFRYGNRNPEIQKILREAGATEFIKLSREEALQALENRNIPFIPREFMERASWGDAAVVNLFIAAGIDPNARGKDGGTALMTAAGSSDKDQSDIVEFLLARGADVNALARRADVNAPPEGGWTALLGAIHEGNSETIRILVDNGADVNIKGPYGGTALVMAARGKGDSELVKLLVEKGADVNAKGRAGRTALMVTRKSETAKILLANGAKVNEKDERGSTALLLVAENGQIDIVKKLIEKGADVNASDSAGNTALLVAMKKHHVDIAKYLVGNGADVNVKNNKGRTPLWLGALNEELIELLREAGAKE